MSMTVDGVWKAGVWAPTVWADGVWREGAVVAPIVPQILLTSLKQLKRRRDKLETIPTPKKKEPRTFISWHTTTMKRTVSKSATSFILAVPPVDTPEQIEEHELEVTELPPGIVEQETVVTVQRAAIKPKFYRHYYAAKMRRMASGGGSRAVLNDDAEALALLLGHE